jgi:hypothetical protein
MGSRPDDEPDIPGRPRARLKICAIPADPTSRCQPAIGAGGPSSKPQSVPRRPRGERRCSNQTLDLPSAGAATFDPARICLDDNGGPLAPSGAGEIICSMSKRRNVTPNACRRAGESDDVVVKSPVRQFPSISRTLRLNSRDRAYLAPLLREIQRVPAPSLLPMCSPGLFLGNMPTVPIG